MGFGGRKDVGLEDPGEALRGTEPGRQWVVGWGILGSEGRG